MKTEQEDEATFEFSADFFESIILSAEDLLFATKEAHVDGIRRVDTANRKFHLAEIEKQFGIT